MVPSGARRSASRVRVTVPEFEKNGTMVPRDATRPASLPFFRSRPGKWLVVAIGATVLVASLLPLSPWADVLGFSVPTRNAYVLIAVLVTAYLLAAERLKTFFFRRMTERTQETKRATA